jgi:hypothetical protein
MTDQTAGTIYRVALQPPAPPPPPPPPPPPAPPATPTSPPTLAAALAAVSAVAKTSVTLAATISEPAGSPPTTVDYVFEYGTSSAYGSSTSSATATATSSGVGVSTTVTGLTPYTTYHYRLVASDCATASCQTMTPDQSFTTGSTLQPVPNVTVGVTVTAGTILVKLRGHHGFTRLRAGELIPLGSTVDARHGALLIQSALEPGAGHVASGLFSGGVFVLRQPAGTTITVLALTSSFASCGGPTPRATARIAAVSPKTKKKRTKKKASHKTVNEVFGNAHGQFSTRGHYATAADQGTRWRAADRCDGTLISVSAGKVTVTDFVHHRTIVLTAGHYYLARTH